jgi:hypothetical protein
VIQTRRAGKGTGAAGNQRKRGSFSFRRRIPGFHSTTSSSTPGLHRRRIPSVERLIPQADMQYKVLSITSAEIVIESKSGAKHIIEYGKGARPHIDLRKVRGPNQVHIAHALFVAEFEPRDINAVVHFGFRHISYIACHCIASQIVPIFCENDIVDVEDFEAIDTARANLSRRLMIALRAEKYGDL